MSLYEIPVTPSPQSFTVSLNGVTYQLDLVWNVFSQAWVLDILDVNGTPLVSSIPLIAGVDLLSPYPHLNFGGQLTVSTEGDSSAIPTFDNLGVSSFLLFTTTP